MPGPAAGLELRHRQHARVEDRIRQAKATGLRNFPCRAWYENNAWLQVVLTATDLITWTKLIAFADHPTLARCEIATFRYRVLHVAARLTRSARQTRLRLDRAWRWAKAIATGFGRIRAAFGSPALPRPHQSRTLAEPHPARQPGPYPAHQVPTAQTAITGPRAPSRVGA